MKKLKSWAEILHKVLSHVFTASLLSTWAISGYPSFFDYLYNMWVAIDSAFVGHGFLLATLVVSFATLGCWIRSLLVLDSFDALEGIFLVITVFMWLAELCWVHATIWPISAFWTGNMVLTMLTCSLPVYIGYFIHWCFSIVHEWRAGKLQATPKK